MSRTNETRHIERHETCKCKCRLDASVCNNKQRWNGDKCRCECKELIDKGLCDKGSIWNRSNCEWKCDKSCDFGEYLNYKNCKCKKKLVDKLVKRSSAEECIENFDEVKIADENVCILLRNLCYLGCNSFSNQHWNWWLFCLFLLVLKKSLAPELNGVALKQQFNEWNSIELINGKSRTNRDKKSDLLLLQRHN